MSCSASEALFERYLDDTLTPAQRARLLAHLAECGRCAGVLEELRVVDALLAEPRRVELPPNFTFATLAEVRALPRPHASRAPLLAYVVSYLAAAWLLAGAGFLLAPQALRAFGETAFDAVMQIVHAGGVVAHAGARMLGDFGAFGTLLGSAIVAVVALCVAVAAVAPRLAERLRS